MIASKSNRKFCPIVRAEDSVKLVKEKDMNGNDFEYKGRPQ